MDMKRYISDPLIVFLSIWIIILSFFSLKISNAFPEENIKLFLFFFISILFFSLGYFLVFFFKSKRKKILNAKKKFSKKRYNLITIIVIIIILGILIINFKSFGYPPFMVFFGFETYNYMEYGRFKGLLFPLLVFLFVSSFYTSKKKSILLKMFSFSILLLYVTRGFIMLTIIFYFYLLVFENKLKNNKHLFLLIILLLVFTTILFGIVGEHRTGTETFYNSLEIKEKYRNYNVGLIWIISYISMPIINLLELTNYNIYFWGENIISRSLPAFLTFNTDAQNFYYSILPNVFNTVGSYLTPIYLDFGIIGVIIYNFLLGVISGYIYKFSKNNLLKALSMTIIILIFFNDFLFYFPTIILIFLSIIFYKFVYIQGCKR